MSKTCQIRCNECRTEGLGSTLKEASANLKCKGFNEPNPNHRSAFAVDGKPMYELKQIIENSYKGQTDLSGKAEAKTPEPPKEEKKEKQEKLQKDSKDK